MLDRGELAFLGNTCHKIVCLGKTYNDFGLSCLVRWSKEIFLYWYFDDEKYLKEAYKDFGTLVFTDYPFTMSETFILNTTSVTELGKRIDVKDIDVYETKLKLMQIDYPYERLYTYEDFKKDVIRTIDTITFNSQLYYLAEDFKKRASNIDFDKISFRKRPSDFSGLHTFDVVSMYCADLKGTSTERFERYLQLYS